MCLLIDNIFCFKFENYVNEFSWEEGDPEVITQDVSII